MIILNCVKIDRALRCELRDEYFKLSNFTPIFVFHENSSNLN